MRHAPNLIAAFAEGERRMIFARHIDGGDLLLLPDGEAKQWRERTKTELRCPIPGCPSPELRTVARHPHKRDGFTHIGGGSGGHSAESYAHLESKGRIAEWLRRRYPHCKVTEEQSTTDRERIADVMIENPNGRKMAFEIQFSALTPAEWKRRHESYRRQEIVDIWLFGSTGAQFRRYAREDRSVLLNPTHEMVAASGQPVYWFNPFAQKIAAAVNLVTADGREYPVPATSHHGELAVYDLESFALFETGFWNEPVRQHHANRDELARREMERQARQAKQLRQREVARAQTLQMAEAEWAQSLLRQRILKRFGGALPGYLEAPIGGKLPVVPAAWQCFLYERFVQGDRDGRTVSIDECARALSGSVAANHEIRYSIAAAWLTGLEKAGLLTRTSNAPWWVGSDESKFLIISREDAERRRQVHAQRKVDWIDPLPLEDDEIETHRPRWDRPRRPSPMLGRARPAPVPVPQKAAVRTCGRCEKPLDPVLWDIGLHVIC
ncbi:hypothetical protein D9V28_04925 [Mycetocola zhadangensis]|uniref:Competence protein CoiA nuclease-like domain-containing protein n=2 Tax=Mycetocola zhadangensis TaxID=1164595 RepID=A0A3L7J9P1_9MICO|nr:hypothetical protein D9V28_04925 [Mycetocola zhadangensis]